MNLSVSAWSFEALPIEGALAVCHFLGFKSVALAGFRNRGESSYDPDVVAADPRHAADHLLPLLEKYVLRPVDFFVQFENNFIDRAINHPDQAVRQKNIDAFREIVRFCQLTHIPNITLLPGMEHLGLTREQNLETAADVFRTLLDIAQPAGITVCFEPHMQSLTDTPERALELLSRVPGLQVALDYSHFVLQYVELERIHALIPHTGIVHIRQARFGKLQTRHAEGTIDFVDIASRLKAVNYTGSLALEYVCAPWFDVNQVDTLTETLTTKRALEAYIPVT